MKKKLGKYWWLELPCLWVAMALADVLLRAAGVDNALPGHGTSFATMTVWVCCVFAIERGLRFVLWAAVLVVAPARAAEMP